MIVVAIDGPAAAGKGTLARRLAKYLDLAYLDTGLLYRAVGWKTLKAGGDPSDTGMAVAAAKALSAEDLSDPALRGDEAANAASKVAAIPAVRAELLEFQRKFAKGPPAGPNGPVKGAVIDGRDLGTVVCPDATAKLFITASLEARVQRRLKELQERGHAAIYARVFEDMSARDARDSTRTVAPLEPAKDALMLDTSDLDPDAVFARALAFIASRTSSY
jgi:cytidylate kinase